MLNLLHYTHTHTVNNGIEKTFEKKIGTKQVKNVIAIETDAVAVAAVAEAVIPHQHHQH